MKGTVIKRGSRYSVVLDLGDDPVTGKRRRKWHSGFTTKRAAEDARIRLLSALQDGMYVDPDSRRVGRFLLDVWLPAMASSLEASTQDGYRATIERWIIPRLGQVELQRLTSAHLNSAYADLLARGGKGGRPLSPRSVRLVHTILRKALKDAVKWNLLARNPADSADPPRQPRMNAGRQLWGVEDACAFIDHMTDDRMRAAWFLALSTGMRRGEVAGLRWRDVDLDHGSVSIAQTRTSVRYEVVTKVPKSANSERVVAIDERTMAELKAHRERQIEERLAFGGGYDVTHDLVFRHEDGAPLHPELVTSWFQRRVAAAGLPPMRFHDLRHLHATFGLQEGVHPLVMSRRLGHANVGITLDTYSHVIPQMDREAATSIGTVLSRRVSSPGVEEPRPGLEPGHVA